MDLFKKSRKLHEFPWMTCGSVHETRKLLRQWYESEPGILLQDEEQRLFDNIVPNLFGYHLLQVGLTNNSDCMRDSRIPHQMILDIDLEADLLDVANPEDVSTCPTPIKGTAEALPVASDSLDVLLLPHTLEFSNNPHEVLREADRVLIPEGYVVVMGFNPWGVWMLWRLALVWRGRPPWCGHFLRMGRLKDWLQLLGFDIEESHRYFFRPPLRQQVVMNKLRFLEKLGRRFWPFFGAAYIIVAKKRVATLTPLKPRWRPRRSRLVVPELAGNSSVNGCNLKKEKRDKA